jgi:hypothetical protein
MISFGPEKSEGRTSTIMLDSLLKTNIENFSLLLQ